MGKSRLFIADSRTEVLFGIRNLLESLFDASLRVADERSPLAAVERSRPDLIVGDHLILAVAAALRGETHVSPSVEA